MPKRFFAGVLVTFLLAARAAGADSVNDALREAFGATLGPLDGAIDAVFSAAGVPSHAARRSVPLIASQGGALLGAAQVTGDAAAVRRVRAVVVVDSSSSAANGGTLHAYIPVDRIEAGPHFHRVYGVALDAVADR